MAVGIMLSLFFFFFFGFWVLLFRLQLLANTGDLSDLGILSPGQMLGISHYAMLCNAMLCFGLGAFRGQEWTGDIFIFTMYFRAID